MSEAHIKESIQAYLGLLKQKGAKADTLEKREKFLLSLTQELIKTPKTSKAYRHMIEFALNNVSPDEWVFYLPVAREYFPFWTNDIKAISSLNARDKFMVSQVDWKPVNTDIKSIWSTIANEKFGVADTWPLKSYSFALRQAGAQQSLVDTRMQLVKLLLVRLRDAPEREGRYYRLAVDATLPLFDMQDTRRLFYAVVREFYYFWIGDPDAKEHILEEGVTSFV